MKSPKFHLREKELKEVIDAERLKFTWSKKLRNFMRDQYVPDVVEHLDFHAAIDVISKQIESQVFRGVYSPLPPNRFLAEKSKGLCRQLVIPDVRDALILQCLSDALWHDIKGKAPTKNSYFEPKDHKFSTDKKHEYGPFFSWLKFQKEIFNFSKERDFVVVTDIANYYDFIRYDHLRNTIAGLTSIRESVLDFLIFILSELLWQPDYMPRVEIGLPQLNFDAPRLLAHAFLYELDKVVSGFPNSDYVRFMDDIDPGVDTVEQAKLAIKNIDLTLQSRHVRLNSGKTEILTSKQAVSHFKIRENAVIDAVEAYLEKASKAEIKTFSKVFSRYLYHSFKFRRRFDSGNGDKILKRCLGIASRYEYDVEPELIWYILYRRPSCRQAIFRWLSSSPLRISRLSQFFEYVLSDHVVDDSSFVEFGKALVNAKATTAVTLVPAFKKFASAISGKGPYALYSAIWILSRYGSSGDLLLIAKGNQQTIAGDNFLSRLVGGLYPRFIGTPDDMEYKQFVMKLGNKNAVEMLNFHYSLTSDPVLVKKVTPVIAAPNPTLPNKINHAKFLMLITIMSSKSHGPKLKDSVIKNHMEYKKDPVYSTLLA